MHKVLAALKAKNLIANEAGVLLNVQGANNEHCAADELKDFVLSRSAAFRFNTWYDFASSRWSFYHEELRNDSARFYSEYLPPGNYHLSYAAQAVAAGEFAVLPLHSEGMYDPDVFGQGVPEVLKIAE